MTSVAYRLPCRGTGEGRGSPSPPQPYMHNDSIVSIRYFLSESDVIAAHRVLGRTAGRRLALLAGAVVVAAGGTWLIYGPAAAVTVLILVPVVLVLAYLVLLPRAWRRAYRAVPREQRDLTVEFSPDGLVFDTPVSHGSVRWQAFSYFIETERLILLYQPNKLAVALPKRAFQPDELHRFRELVSAHVPDGRPARRRSAGAVKG
jgi:YcxB-like protein